MIRLFFQLYLLIVTTLIGVGWGLEKLWQLYGDNKSAEETSLNNTLLVLEHRLVNLSPERWSGYVEELSHATPLEILVFEFKELSGDSVTDKLREGEIAHMQGEHNQWIVLKKSRRNGKSNWAQTVSTHRRQHTRMDFTSGVLCRHRPGDHDLGLAPFQRSKST